MICSNIHFISQVVITKVISSAQVVSTQFISLLSPAKYSLTVQNCGLKHHSFLGRLLRANHLELNWYKLAAWVNITEQWPYRLSWIILEVEDNDNLEDSVTLKNIYDM